MDQEIILSLEVAKPSSAKATSEASTAGSSLCESISIRKEESGDSSSSSSSGSGGKICLTVSVPREVDAECATIATELFLDHLELLPITAHVSRLKISNLRFSKGGVGVIKSFVSIHASTVKHVSLHYLVGRDASKLDREALNILASSFESIPLETLDLSHNVLDANVWEAWSKQSALDKLVLKDVDLDDASLKAMADHFASSKCLSRLHVSNMRSISDEGTAAACRVVEKCSNLCSLRWASNDANATPPCLGLKTLAFRGFQTKSGNLRRVEIEGGAVTGIIFKGGLCGAIECLNRLEHLKLRRLGLGPRGTMQVVAALKTAKAPLSFFDISENAIGNEGAVALAQMANQRTVMRHLKALVVEKNDIGNKGAQTLLHIFAANSITLQLEGNPFDAASIAMALVAENAAMRMNATTLEKDRARVKVELNLSKKQVRQLTSEQTYLLGKIHSMEKDLKRLTEERDSLSRALATVETNGNGNGGGGGRGSHFADEERSDMLERLAKLEQMVLGQGGGGGGNNNNASSSNMDIVVRPRAVPTSSRLLRSQSEVGFSIRPMMGDDDEHSQSLEDLMAAAAAAAASAVRQQNSTNDFSASTQPLHRRGYSERWDASLGTLQRHPSMNNVSSSSLQLASLQQQQQPPQQQQQQQNVDGFIKDSNSPGRQRLTQAASSIRAMGTRQKSLRSMGHQSLRSLGSSMSRIAVTSNNNNNIAPRQASQRALSTSPRNLSPSSNTSGGAGSATMMMTPNSSSSSPNGGSVGNIIVTTPTQQSNGSGSRPSSRRTSMTNAMNSSSGNLSLQQQASRRLSAIQAAAALQASNNNNSNMNGNGSSSSNMLLAASSPLSTSTGSLSFPLEITPGFHNFSDAASISTKTADDDGVSLEESGSVSGGWIAFPNGQRTPTSCQQSQQQQHHHPTRQSLLLRTSSEARLAMLARRNRSCASSTSSTSSLSSVSTPASDTTPGSGGLDAAKRNPLATSPKTVLLKRAFSGRRLFG